MSPSIPPTVHILQGDNLSISTAYYSATIPIWHDQINLSSSAIKDWEAEWRTDEAREVVRSIGAFVVVTPKPLKKDDLDIIRTLLTTLTGLITHHTQSAVDSYSVNNEPLLLYLGLHQPKVPRLEISNEEWEDMGRECGGWEWIDGEVEGEGRNGFGEKVGLGRLLETLEAHEWGNAEDGAAIPDDFELEEDDGLSRSAVNILGDESGAREPILSGPSSKSKEESNRDTVDEGTDDEIQELEGMMLKLQAIKDMGADLPEAERRKMAAKAVGDLMKEM
ncbi:MAG: hypothetical protein HETSPECPRED_003496 [Heterodermia speciosa]|uniref:Uncharacterized protein n=1 Tax=Heterodermia speciosa TaxID=116794 RepID=A0A8H3EER6_9LECA|nr:MAG: hypothetical protein HETSPECPRED_003496 [Heterodermia speciosa]